MNKATSQSCSPALHVRHTGADAALLVFSAPAGADPAVAAAEGYSRLAAALQERNLAIVQERVFGSLAVEHKVSIARGAALQLHGVADGPYTYLQGRPTWGEGLAGAIVRAAPAGQVKTLRDGDGVCGRCWQRGTTRQFVLQNMQGLLASDSDNAPATQARRAIQRADRILRENGASYRQVARTWFYLANILGWYGEFNAARTAAYTEFGLMPTPGDKQKLPPASTGIRADVPSGAACTLDLLAVAAPEASAVQFLRNPRQQEALRYGSAFSRCAVIRSEGEGLIELSGTAAIDEAGKSLHHGDIRAQVRCTLDRVATLIGQAGASLRDIAAATIFVKHAGDADAAREVVADLGLELLPAVWVVADVCREELLFEIDAEVALPSPT